MAVRPDSDWLLRLAGIGIVLWMLSVDTVRAQTHPEAGRPLVTAYGWSDYDADPENWTITQDARGVLYFGNLGGVLEYDGETWRLTPLPNRSHVRALTVDADDRVWVGGRGDFGYLAPDTLGQTQFVSLLDHVPDSLRAFDEVWRAIATSEGVYFITDYTLFRWDGQTMHTWSTDAFGIEAVEGTVYVDQWGQGLSRIEGDALRLVPGGERFADTTIYTILPFGDGRVLLGTRSDGLWLYDPSATTADARFSSFPTEADDIFAEGRLFVPGAVLPGGRFAFSTRAAGLVVIDREGRLLHHLDPDDGLVSNDVGYVYLDRAGDLWLAHRRGLSRIEIDAPFTRFDARSGLPTQVYYMARYDGLLYAATADGLYRLEPEPRMFRRIPGPTGQVLGLYPAADELLINNDGIWRLEGNGDRARLTVVPGGRDINSFESWNPDSTLWLLGHDAGLDVLRWVGGRWVRERSVPGVEAAIEYFAQDPAGVLWLGTDSESVVRVQPTEQDDPFAAAEVTTFGVADGLPDVDFRMFTIGSDLYVVAVGGDVFRFDAATSRFVPDPAFDAARSGHPLSYYYMSEGPDGSVWVAQQFGPPSRLQPVGGGRYVDASGSLGRLREFLVNDVYPGEEGVAWLMGLEQLVRYDAQAEQSATVPPVPFFRRVTVGNRLLYAGDGPIPAVTVPPDGGSVHFAYAAGRYDGVRYRTRLDGLEDTWTAWSPEAEREFSRLPPGRYTLRVQAEGASGSPGPEATYAFTVLPPWWRTWWAYLGYALFLAGSVFAIDRMQRRRLIARERKRARELETRLRVEAAEATANYLQAENERQTQELEQARALQLSMLPDRMPEHPLVEVAAGMQTATEVGGDYYDFHVAEDGTFTVAIGDATGHGAQAGTMVTATKSLFTTYADEPDPAAVLRLASHALRRMRLPKLYMAFALGKLRGRTLEVAGAGMPPALVWRASSGCVETVPLKGLPLGGPMRYPYRSTRVELAEGDTVLLLSDGFPELVSESGEMFGYEGVQAVFAEAASGSAEAVVRHFEERAATWLGGQAPGDDMTFVVMKLREESGLCEGT